eukprot:TRINITY_DN8429_c0_g1_i3.p1 TRINITY_DN8429_c0_g1~~TRINITY_DN8429_c0_g1_i3.p1  ORF type:complete len:643 (+),score=34.35 TRINITY_DN8429_c0_g1_i3:62-1990(+)
MSTIKLHQERFRFLFAFSFMCTIITRSVIAQTTAIPCIEVNGAWQIDATCIDALYNNVTDLKESDETVPVPHHHISGKVGTSDFNIYLPSPSAWNNRLFQTTYPLQSSVASPDQIAFASASGAGIVQVTGLLGYRTEAAVTKYAKKAAAKYYNSSAKIFAILSGGSGGSYPTTGAMENTKGVWEGYVPFIVGSPVALPYSFFARTYARFVLGDKGEMIADAIRPGGSGDPYATLNALEKQVFDEVLLLGVPIGGWAGLDYFLGGTRNNLGQTSGNLLGFGDNVRSLDPTYATDFWSKEGYLGMEHSPLGEYFRQGRVMVKVTVESLQLDSAGALMSFTISGLPVLSKPWIPMDCHVLNGSVAIAIQGTLNTTTSIFTLGTNNADALTILKKGAIVSIDNSWSLALMAYPRAQTPSALDFYTYNQYRNSDGTSKYPVRPFHLGSFFSSSVSGGAVYSGNFTGKVIMIDNLLDVDAPPTHADWYSLRAKKALGSTYDDNFRLWYFENADHVGTDPARLIPPNGVLERAFREVAEWVQYGIVPVRSTVYTVSTLNQIGVGSDAHSRGGIQPSVQLTVGGSDKITVAVGQPVTFDVVSQAASDGSSVVAVSWDFTGSGTYIAGTIVRSANGASATATHTYSAPSLR